VLTCTHLSVTRTNRDVPAGRSGLNTHSGVEDQPQYRGLWHSGSPSARSFSRSPSPPPPSFTQYPSPPRSLVRDYGQTSPLRPRLDVSRSTCPPLSPSPHANSFVIGTAVINTHTKTIMFFKLPGPPPVVNSGTFFVFESQSHHKYKKKIVK
jgi:hypothetical protein